MDDFQEFDGLDEEGFEEMLQEMDEEPEDEVRDIISVLADYVEGAASVTELYTEWLEVADQITDRLGYENAVAIGQVTRESDDTFKWVIGDVLAALTGDTDYGQKVETLNRFAGDTGLTYGRVREWHDCAAYWVPKLRKVVHAADKDGFLSWSHFNRARRGLEFEDACDMLKKAVDEGWGANKMVAEVRDKEGTQKKVSDTATLVSRAIRALKQLSGAGVSRETIERAAELVILLGTELVAIEKGQANDGIS